MKCTPFIIGLVLFVSGLTSFGTANAFGECTQYGSMAIYDYLTDSCKCMSGYVFQEKYYGTTCVSAASVCTEKYGYGASYDSLSKSCECNYGYAFAKNIVGETQCISYSTICTDQLGSRARYNSLYDRCECGSGDIIINGKCTNANSYCWSQHGMHAEYDSLAKNCDCASGYTFDDNLQCVEKQNNVYFNLKELDTDNQRAIVRSQYDYGYYLIEYGAGCYPSSFRRYVGSQIVVNLGTDYDLDRWDKIVLQDDDEVCDIKSVVRADFDTTLQPTEEDIVYDPPAALPVVFSQPITPTVAPQTQNIVIPTPIKDFLVSEGQIIPLDSRGEIFQSASFRKCPSVECTLIRYFAEGSIIQLTGKYQLANWYRVSASTDAGGGGEAIVGWVHGSLVQLDEGGETEDNGHASILPTTTPVLGSLVQTASSENLSKKSNISESKEDNFWGKFVKWLKFWE